MAKRRKQSSQGSPEKNRRWRLPRFRVNFSWIKLPNAHVLKRTGVGLAWLFAVVGIIAAWSLGVPRLQAFVSQRRAVDPSDVTIRLLNTPSWVPASLSEMLLRTASMQIRGDFMVRDDLVAVRQALLDTGWFDAIKQVRRVQENIVEIDAQFVVPYALVRDAEGDHLIDATGKLLAMTFEKDVRPTKGVQHKNEYKMITITGTHFSRPRRVGTPWEGTDLLAGIRLLALIEQQSWRHQVSEIDVSGYLKDKPIKLRTNIGCTIVWGGAPGEEPALEVLAPQKLERLNFLYKNHGRIDRHLTGELDITNERAVVSR